MLVHLMSTVFFYNFLLVFLQGKLIHAVTSIILAAYFILHTVLLLQVHRDADEIRDYHTSDATKLSIGRENEKTARASQAQHPASSRIGKIEKLPQLTTPNKEDTPREVITAKTKEKIENNTAVKIPEGKPKKDITVQVSSNQTLTTCHTFSKLIQSFHKFNESSLVYTLEIIKSTAEFMMTASSHHETECLNTIINKYFEIPAHLRTARSHSQHKSKVSEQRTSTDKYQTKQRLETIPQPYKNTNAKTIAFLKPRKVGSTTVGSLLSMHAYLYNKELSPNKKWEIVSTLKIVKVATHVPT